MLGKKVPTQSEMVIGVQCCFILKHYPFKPLKLTKLANVGHLARHNGFRDFPIQFVNAMCSIRPYIGLKFKVINPKVSLGRQTL